MQRLKATNWSAIGAARRADVVTFIVNIAFDTVTTLSIGASSAFSGCAWAIG